MTIVLSQDSNRGAEKYMMRVTHVTGGMSRLSRQGARLVTNASSGFQEGNKRSSNEALHLYCISRYAAARASEAVICTALWWIKKTAAKLL